MNIIGIIPARMASTRFPGKPLKQICGIPMIGHVYLRSKRCRLLNDVYVATCDSEIADYLHSVGGEAIMTSDKHERASDRTAEAMVKIEKKTGKRADIVVMIQGDEPMLIPEMLDELIQSAENDRDVGVINLISPIENAEEFNNPNVVKVVADRAGYALYFSREPIPSLRKYSGQIPMWKQLGMILFRRDALLEYVEMPATPLEVIESVDMNRVLENGRKILLVGTHVKTCAVDTETDLQQVGKLIVEDRLFQEYATGALA